MIYLYEEISLLNGVDRDREKSLPGSRDFTLRMPLLTYLKNGVYYNQSADRAGKRWMFK
jgi:hypothetical protein